MTAWRTRFGAVASAIVSAASLRAPLMSAVSASTSTRAISPDLMAACRPERSEPPPIELSIAPPAPAEHARCIRQHDSGDSLLEAELEEGLATRLSPSKGVRLADLQSAF